MKSTLTTCIETTAAMSKGLRRCILYKGVKTKNAITHQQNNYS